MGMPLALRLGYHTGAVTDIDADDTAARADIDAALVARARAGEYAAFEQLVRKYRNDVYALSYHYVRDREEAWDLSQEVFVKVHRALRRFRGEASFKTWLLRITSNQCKDFFKKRRLKTVALETMEGHTDPPAAAQRPDERLASKELGQKIQQALETLPEKHRSAIVLREFQGLSYEAMAEVMECSLGTVMSRLHHARKKMQKALTAMGVAGEH
jgi:RNA polymerase sigma-70 factor (ECF subfamily)